MATWEELRARHTDDAMHRLPELVARLGWSREQVAAEQTGALRRLVAAARERSPWHARRLRHLDPETLTTADLPLIPPMTKADLMTHYDDIVTDRRLTHAGVDAHLDALRDAAYLLDTYHAVASGGSSGQRGIFVYDWDGWLMCFLGYTRHLLTLPGRLPGPPIADPVLATVASAHATHMTTAVSQTFLGDSAAPRFPVTQPLAEIVDGLNRLQPTFLMTYASMLGPLVAEARAGRLRIAPRVVFPSSEPLLPGLREAAREAWNAAVVNTWGTSEACVTGVGCGLSDGLHLQDDLVIVEPVDAAGRPVPPGTRSAKVYLTNLFNLAQPLIRYEVTDEVVEIDDPCPCGMPLRRIADIEGRADDVFVYPGGLVVHPHVFRTVLAQASEVAAYRVTQTPRGAEVAVQGHGVDAAALAARLGAALAAVGLAGAEVSVTHVGVLERTAAGKLKRFVPLGGG